MNKEERLKKLLDWEARKPDDAFLKYAIAQEFISFEDDENARIYFELLMNNFPDYLATYYQYAKLLERIGKITDAQKVYLAGITLAKAKGDNKTMRELNEALTMLQDE
ncbi:MAG: hypothetical protein U0T74_00945 [Chitinophagales bacterium]